MLCGTAQKFTYYVYIYAQYLPIMLKLCSIIYASVLMLLLPVYGLIPYLFHCPYKSLNSSSEIYPVFH